MSSYLQTLFRKFIFSSEFQQNYSKLVAFSPYLRLSLLQIIFYIAFWLKTRVIYLVNNWIYTTNHKRIAVNYFWFVILAGVVGMVLATAIRLEFAYPGVGIFAGDSLQYITVASAHGVIMVFFMIMPLLFGAFGNFLLPTQLGVHDVAFPRLNSAAFWFLPSGLIMLAQLVCVDRRFQRMNCFNIREVQALLKQRFFADLMDEGDRHSFLDRTMIGAKFRFWGQESLTSNNLLEATGGPVSTLTNRNQEIENPILREGGSGNGRKVKSSKKYSKTHLAVISGCVISLHDSICSLLINIFYRNSETKIKLVSVKEPESEIDATVSENDSLVRRNMDRLDLISRDNRDAGSTRWFSQRYRRFLWFNFVWDLSDMMGRDHLTTISTLSMTQIDVRKFFTDLRCKCENLWNDFASASIYIFFLEGGIVAEMLVNFKNIPSWNGTLIRQTLMIPLTTVSQLLSSVILIQKNASSLITNLINWGRVDPNTCNLKSQTSRFPMGGVIAVPVMPEFRIIDVKPKMFDLPLWMPSYNTPLSISPELDILAITNLTQNPLFANMQKFITIGKETWGELVIRTLHEWYSISISILVINDQSLVVSEFLTALKRTITMMKYVTNVILIPTEFFNTLSGITIFGIVSMIRNEKSPLPPFPQSMPSVTRANFSGEWNGFHFNANYLFLESVGNGRILRSENPIFKYDYKGGDYFPKNLREGFPSLLTTLLNVGGLRPATWFLSSVFHENIRLSFFPLTDNPGGYFGTQSRAIFVTNGFNATQWWREILSLHFSNDTQISASWNSMISLNHKFVRMFLSSPMQQRVLANWRQLKLTREAWRCKLLATRHQRTLYQRYLNEDGVFWSIERNARDLIPGWAMITPFTSRVRFTAIGKVDIGLVGVLLVLNSSIISAANFLVTYRYLSTLNNRKMRDARSFFTEGVMVASWMMIAANPMLVIGIVMLLSDRHWQTSFFDYSGGGDTILFQHMFWFFGHPEVYIIMIPVFGFTNTVLSYYLRKRVSARASLMYSMYTIAFLGFFVWGHHMYMVGLAHTTRMLFSTLTVMISVPAATKLMHWCVTIANSAFSMEVPLLFILTFIFFFISGGISGMCVAHTGMDILFHDTFYVVGHFHVMLAGAAMFGSFGAFYFYFPAIFGVRYSRIYAYLHFSYYLLGQLMTVIPMFWLGYAGMPRRVLDYPASMGGWHSVISAGHLLSVGGMLAFFIMIFDSLRQAKTSFRNTFGINRYNTRLSFYLFEIIRLQRHASRQAFLLKFAKTRIVIRGGRIYRNWEPAETTLFSYLFLKRKTN